MIHFLNSQVIGLGKGSPIRLLTSLLASCLCCTYAQTKEFCALSVELVPVRGTQLRHIPVRLLDQSGKAVFDEQVNNPAFRICDFGFGPHTLVVGSSNCHPMEIHGLRLRFGEPITLTVPLNECQRDVWMVVVGCTFGCVILLLGH